MKKKIWFFERAILEKINLKNILFHINKILFHSLYRKKFRFLPYSSTIAKPLKLEGTEYISILQGTYIDKYSWLGAYNFNSEPPEIFIGKNSSIGFFLHVSAIRKVIIGDGVLIASRVFITDNYHGFEDPATPIIKQPLKFKGEVYIGDGTWIGENVSIIGTRIGKNCVIGANSVVTKNIPDFSIAVGSPARVIKTFDFEEKVWKKVNVE